MSQETWPWQLRILARPRGSMAWFCWENLKTGNHHFCLVFPVKIFPTKPIQWLGGYSTIGVFNHETFSSITCSFFVVVVVDSILWSAIVVWQPHMRGKHGITLGQHRPPPMTYWNGGIPLLNWGSRSNRITSNSGWGCIFTFTHIYDYICMIIIFIYLYIVYTYKPSKRWRAESWTIPNGWLETGGIVTWCPWWSVNTSGVTGSHHIHPSTELVWRTSTNPCVRRFITRLTIADILCILCILCTLW